MTATAAAQTETARDRFFRLAFRSAAFLEACTWVGMLTAMVIKYPLQGSPMWVTVWGWIHGTVWILFVVAMLAAAAYFRWPLWTVPIGFAMSVLPFLTIPFDLWMERTGRLRVGWRERQKRPATL